MHSDPAFYLASRKSTFRMCRSIARLLEQLHSCRRGAIAPLTALMLIPISGALAFAVELGSWQYMQRSAQNAADSAAIAAATVDSAGGKSGTTTSFIEAKAAAAKFGFVDGTGNTTLTVEDTVANAASLSCPSGVPVGSTCYRATITTQFPLLFSKVLGFTGSGGGVQQIVSSAVAINKGGGVQLKQICVWSLSAGTNSFQSNGGPKPDMAGCSLLSNGNMRCNGHDLGADYGIAVGTSSGCGQKQVSGSTGITDPFVGIASNIPASALSGCGGTFPQSPSKKNDPALPASNLIAGSYAWTGNKIFCGDVQLTDNVTLTGSETVVYIENGRLDLNGKTLKTATGAAATIVFSGTNSNAYSHYPTGGGTLDITAPDSTSSSPWKGVAIYQDPAITQNISFTYSGNSPAWNISGLVYLPKADVTFSGVVNKSSTGKSCFVLVTYTILINGTGQIFANTQCDTAGLTPPTLDVGGGAVIRERLVR
jgi:Flp pilus assembly protein TadG